MTTTIVDQRGGLKVVRQTFPVSSATHRQAIDVTPQVRGAVHGAGVSNGHLVRLIGRLVNDDAPYKHNDARLSDCERGNAAAHLRATLLGHGVAVGVTDSELLLAGSQAIILAEWDGPRPRQMHVQIMGV